MDPVLARAFLEYLVATEEKAAKTAREYRGLVQRAISGDLLSLDRGEVMEKAQWACLAFRRLMASRTPLVAYPWPPVAAWANAMSTADPPRDGRFVFTAERARVGAVVSCVACGEQRERHDLPFTEESVRALAILLVEDHDRDPWCGAWCEPLERSGPERAYHLIYLEPPSFRTWAQILAIRGPEGKWAHRWTQQLVVWLHSEDQDEAQQLVEEHEGRAMRGGCRCGYLAVSGAEGSDCPCCGLA